MLSRSSSDTKTKSRKTREPLDVDLSVSFRFGDEPEDKVTVINNRRVPMVGSVFDSRDALVRGFLKLLFKASMMQPRVVRELVPALRLLRRGR